MASVGIILDRRGRIIFSLENRKYRLAQDEMHGLTFIIVEQEAGNPIDTLDLADYHAIIF